jgi:hypothetical protein
MRREKRRNGRAVNETKRRAVNAPCDGWAQGLTGHARGNREGEKATRCPCRLLVEKGRAKAHVPSREQVSGPFSVCARTTPERFRRTVRRLRNCVAAEPLAEALHRRRFLALDARTPAPRARHSYSSSLAGRAREGKEARKQQQTNKHVWTIRVTPRRAVLPTKAREGARPTW